jgi:hypothetical protein
MQQDSDHGITGRGQDDARELAPLLNAVVFNADAVRADPR